MRVAELCGRRQFCLVQRSIPEPGPDEVQVRVGAVGICGSDLHSYAEGAVGDTACVYPMVLGHEPAGTVLKTGTGVTGWSPGDRAAFEPALFCYHCEFCMAGKYNLCANIRFMSLPGEPGFFRECANVPARNLLALPANLSLHEGTLFEPLSVVLHSLQFTALKLGETAVVFGAGPMGLLTTAALKLAGAGRVWVVDPVPHRLDLARQLGADALIDSRAVNPVQQIQADTGKRGVDVAVDCAAKGDSIDHCIHSACSGGRVVITGIPSELRVSVDLHTLRRKELAFFNVRRSNHESGRALELLSEHQRRFAPLITHAEPLERIDRAFMRLERYEDGIGKIVITAPGS